jgi:hypothetical protein
MNPLEQLRLRIADKLADISEMFERPTETRITIVIRTPWLPDGGVLISDDDFTLALAEIERLRIKPIIGVDPSSGEGRAS